MVKQATIWTAAAALAFSATAVFAQPDPAVPTGIFTRPTAGNTLNLTFNKFIHPDYASSNPLDSLSNFVTTEIIFDTGGTGYSALSFWLQVGAGDIFQSSFGTDLAVPNPALTGLPNFETLTFDTYFADGSGDNTSPMSASIKASHTYPSNGAFTSGFLGSMNLVGADGVLNATATSGSNLIGSDLVIMQITLAPTANGWFELDGGTLGLDEYLVGGGLITNGMLMAIPLPAAAWMGIGLLGAMGAIRTARRKKSD